MKACEDVAKRLAELAALRPDEVPAGDRGHLAGCPACARALAGARLARGLVAAAAEVPEPPAGFVERVLATLPARLPRGRIPDPWRSAWGLVPAFAATAVMLVIFFFQAGSGPVPSGLLPLEDLSASERLVLETSAPNPDLVLTAVLEGGGR